MKTKKLIVMGLGDGFTVLPKDKYREKTYPLY